MKKIIFGNDKNIISKNLKLKRLEKKLTQDELAAKMQTLGVNIDQQMISKIEKNARIVTDYELVCFCRALDVNIIEMLEDFYDKERRNLK